MPPESLPTLLLHAYLVGWMVAAPIGPVNLEIIRRSLRDRLAAGFCVGLGATMVDLSYMMLTGFGLGPLLRHPAFLLATYVLGGMLLGWLAWGALSDGVREWRKARLGEPVDMPAESNATPPRATLLRSWLVGLAMTAANPMTIIFWATLPGLLFRGAPPSPEAVLAAGAFVWLGAFSWVALLMGILWAASRLVGPRLFAVASLLGGAAMAYFALKFWWMAAHFAAAAPPQ